MFFANTINKIITAKTIIAVTISLVSKPFLFKASL